MKKTLLAILSFTFLAGCSLVPIHKMDIEQGNVITPEMVAHIHTGMTEAQVKSWMGNPVLVNTFNDNRADYVYTFKPGRGKMTVHYITLIFRNGILQEFSGNMYSPFIKS